LNSPSFDRGERSSAGSFIGPQAYRSIGRIGCALAVPLSLPMKQQVAQRYAYSAFLCGLSRRYTLAETARYLVTVGSQSLSASVEATGDGFQCKKFNLGEVYRACDAKLGRERENGTWKV